MFGNERICFVHVSLFELNCVHVGVLWNVFCTDFFELSVSYVDMFDTCIDLIYASFMKNKMNNVFITIRTALHELFSSYCVQHQSVNIYRQLNEKTNSSASESHSR